jgi:hypothetical protein
MMPTDVTTTLRAGGPVLFVAVATGQNAANLPPILEMAEPGDQVLWLESAEARARRWAEGAREVLTARQIGSLDAVSVPDEPAGTGEALRQALAWHPSRRPVFVHNGGTKLTSLILDRTLGAGPRPILYGLERPAELWVFPEGIDGPLERRRYRRAGMGIAEILCCSGHRLSNLLPGSEGPPALRLWPAACDLGTDQYGVDAAATAQAHENAHHRYLDREAAEDIFAKFEAALRLLPHRVGFWCKSVMDNTDALRRRAIGPVTDWPAFAQEYSGQWQIVFNTAAKIAHDAHARAGSKSVPGDGRLGARFELAVARRLQVWLAAHGAAAAVVEAWHNVKIKRLGPSDLVAEWDLTLVLNNGVLLSLECKSFECESKDLDARLLNLQRAATRPAKMVICVPLYTAFDDRDWFRATLKKSERIREVGQDWIALTLPGQPADYSGQAPDGSPVRLRCPPFEERLDTLLAPYRPTAA